MTSVEKIMEKLIKEPQGPFKRGIGEDRSPCYFPNYAESPKIIFKN